MSHCEHPTTSSLARSAVHRGWLVPLAIFATVLAVYLVNPDPTWSGDMNAISVLVFNVLEHGTLWLDPFRNSHLASSFSDFGFFTAPRHTLAAGHYIPGYPVGAAIVTAPLYLLFYVYMKIIVPSVSILTAEFEPYRQYFLHVSGAVTSAATVALFFVVSRMQFGTRVALATTACLAFATMQWGFLSQSLMQHGPSSLIVMAAWYALLRADRSAQRTSALLCVAGLLTGLLFGIRPTNLVFTAALFVFVTIWFGQRTAIFAAAFAIPTIATLLWNVVLYGSLIGSGVLQTHSYDLSPATFITALTGLLFSPNRSLLFNSPFLVFAITAAAPVVCRIGQALAHGDLRDVGANDLLFCALLGASATLFLSYAFSPFWSGGFYGNRYVSETVPFIAFGLNYLHFLTTPAMASPRWRATVVVFAFLVLWGMFTQVTAIVGGHQGLAQWSSLPVADIDAPVDRRWAYMTEAPLRAFQTRVWDLRDNIYLRIWRGVLFRNFVFRQADAGSYLPNCKAAILGLVDQNGDAITSLEVVALPEPPRDQWDQAHQKRRFLRAAVRNDGTVPLYGYQHGTTWGIATVVHQVFDESGKQVYENGTIYVSGTIGPAETGTALGNIETQVAPGRYRIDFRMAVNGLGFCGAQRYSTTLVIRRYDQQTSDAPLWTSRIR